MVNWFSPWNLISRTHVRLNQPVFKEQRNDCPHLLTAQEAWVCVVEHFKWTKEHVALKEVESIGVVNNDGTAFGWRFCLDLLNQQGTAIVVWEALRAPSGCVVGNRLHCTSIPYPAIGSPVYQVVAHGMGGEKLLNAAWKQMRENTQDLPWDFVDSNHIALMVFDKGWVGAYHLRTTTRAASIMWEAYHNEQKLMFSFEDAAPYVGVI